MKQELALERRLCARNAGIGMISRLLVVFILLLLLNAVFEIPGEATLTAANNIKTNALLFTLMIIAVLVISFFTLMATAAGNNVLMPINRNLSISAAVLRLLEGLFFILSMILLFSNISSFDSLLLIGRIFYAFYLVLLGYLVFNAGYLNKFLGISLMIGGLMGYLIEGLTHFFLPSYEWLSATGLMVAVLAEFSLGTLLIMTAIKMTLELPDPKTTITTILERIGEGTTAEIIDEASQKSHDCKDRIPKTLLTLEEDKIVTKRISKERKALVWMLAS